jgi:hypothetical protein
VGELDPPGVQTHKLERGAGDHRLGPASPRHTAHEGSLARTQWALQEDQVTSTQAGPKPLTRCLGLGRHLGDHLARL